MQFLIGMKETVGRFAQDNAAALLTAGGVVGTVATAVLAGRGGYKYAEIVRKKQDTLLVEKDEGTYLGDVLYNDETVLPELDKWDKAKIALPYVLPPVLVGGFTIASIIMSNRISAQKAAALAAAYGLAERNLSEYKEKVAEKLTGPKKQAIDDELAQDRVNKSDGFQNVVIIEGKHLCYDEATNRYFHGTMEDIKRAVNAVNQEIYSHDYADATFFYHELEMEKTVWSEEVGWNRDHPCELKITTTEAPDGRPCIAINFSNFPRQDFIRPNHG